MDRQTELKRLRYLLAELVKQFEGTPFNVLNWSETSTVIQEIDRLASDLAVGRLPLGGPDLTKTLWEPLREDVPQDNVVNNLKPWVRHVDHLLATDIPPVGQRDVDDDEPLTDTQQEVYDVITKDGPIIGKRICNAVGIPNLSTLTKDIIPVLKKRRGVKNKRGCGYYVD